MHEANSTAALAFATKVGGENASSVTNSDIVNPMPHTHPTPQICFQVIPSGKLARPLRTANQLKSAMPTGFPRHNPNSTPKPSGVNVVRKVP